MDRCEQKIKIVEKIKKTKNWDLLDDIEKQLEEQPQYITDYIVEIFEKEFGHLGHNGDIGDIYCRNEVMIAFEYDVRRAFIEIGRKNLIPNSDYINHWTDLYVETKLNNWTDKKYEEDLDTWIIDNIHPAFNVYMIAETIFQIWCEKVTFKEP